MLKVYLQTFWRVYRMVFDLLIELRLAERVSHRGIYLRWIQVRGRLKHTITLHCWIYSERLGFRKRILGYAVV